MNDNKDIMDKDIKDSRQTMPDLSSNVFLRAEKLTSALYMVTDFLSDNEPLKWKLRSRSVDLLSDTSKFVKDNQTFGVIAGECLLSAINEIVSLLSVAYFGGAVSKMNFEILKQEYEMFGRQIAGPNPTHPLVQFLTFVPSQDQERFNLNSFGHRRDLENNLTRNNKALTASSFEKTNSRQTGRIGQMDNKKDTGNDLYGLNSKEGKKSIRKEQIVTWLKDKTWTSIADIAKSLPDCGPKTVQRELLEMVSLGVLKKQGERRWSRYMLS